MSKHTPGPWKAIRYDSANSKGERITGFYIGCNADDQGFHKIANIEIEEHSSGGRYNSDLIAAAPDLLDALECLLADAPENGLLSVANARVVIARARGEA